jgi:uncharacterized protein YbjT (DUF2867 family)
MRVVLIGATGMVGQGVLRACLKARDVIEIIVVGRRALLGYEDPQPSDTAWRNPLQVTLATP